MLGKLTTIDPCSLVDTGAFAEFGTAEIAAPESLDDCLVKIRTSGSETVDLYVGSLDSTDSYPDLAAKPSTEVSGGLKVVDYEADSEFFCTQLLVFSDGVTLSVTGSVYENEEPKLCDMVEAGMGQVVEVVRGDDVKHRDFPPNSLGRLDPCEATPAATVAKVPGLGSVEAKEYPGRHGCSWTAADNSVRVRVLFGVGEPPKPNQGGSQAPIADRPSVLVPTPEAGSFSFCSAHTAHIGFRAEGRSGLVEIATVFVRMKEGQVDAACTAATDVAAAVWPKLPKP